MSPIRRVALKVDCDTFQGTKTGIPNLLRLFDRIGIKASFFFTLGPDCSGRAIRRVFTQKGFLKKMLRSNAVSMYGPKTLLYGTILPAPHIGKRLKATIKSVAEAGYEVGIHGWDHVRWHDHLGKMDKRDIEDECARSHEVFNEIFGRKARSMAAPGWHSTQTFLWVQDSYDLLYSSNTRLGPPHFPIAGKIRYKTLEIPTTLPTWDEALAAPEFKDQQRLLDDYSRSINGTEVHTIHTEVEGMNYLTLFEKLLNLWKSSGVEFITLENLANEQLKNRDIIPFRSPSRITIPNRGGLVSSSLPIEDAVLSA